MKFGLFYEISVPRPWGRETEKTVYDNCLEQVALADSLGFDSVWAVEHHFLEEYSHCPAPELFLTACAMKTKKMRVGHGIVLRARDRSKSPSAPPCSVRRPPRRRHRPLRDLDRAGRLSREQAADGVDAGRDVRRYASPGALAAQRDRARPAGRSDDAAAADAVAVTSPAEIVAAKAHGQSRTTWRLRRAGREGQAQSQDHPPDRSGRTKRRGRAFSIVHEDDAEGVKVARTPSVSPAPSTISPRNCSPRVRRIRANRIRRSDCCRRCGRMRPGRAMRPVRPRGSRWAIRRASRAR